MAKKLFFNIEVNLLKKASLPPQIGHYLLKIEEVLATIAVNLLNLKIQYEIKMKSK